MNAPSKKTWAYILGIVVLCLLMILGWFAFHQEPPPSNQQPMKAEVVKPVTPAFEQTDNLSSETPTNQTGNSITTNAADLYRQAFALYDALSKDEKGLLRDWQTDVDASVEAELCEKIHPICDLMYQASTMTNCNWGIEPITVDTKWTHLDPSHFIARAALWNAAHCRSNDVSGAVDDTVAVLRLGQRVSQTAMIGGLVGMALQRMAASYVAQNLGRFQDADADRLAAAFNDLNYEGLSSRAMEQEADMLDRYSVRLPSLPVDEAEKGLAYLYTWSKANPSEMSRNQVLAQIKQVADSERELAHAWSSSSDDEYERWAEGSAELQKSNPFARGIIPGVDEFVDRVQRAEVTGAMIAAALVVAENGESALPSHPDPSSGQPFVYTETPDGFQLQSTYAVDGKPMTMQFKSR